MEKTLDSWLKEQKVPAITGIDTRALTKKLRELEQKYMKTKLTTRAGKEKNLRAGFVIRQEIAIIKTIMGQKSSI